MSIVYFTLIPINQARSKCPALDFSSYFRRLWIRDLFQAIKKTERARNDDRAYQCSLRYEGSDQWLDSLGVSRDARILSVFSYPQNSPFIQMGRKGYSLMWFDKEIVDGAMEFPFDYAVVEDKSFCDCFEGQKRLLGRLKRLAGNGNLSLCCMEDTIVNDCADDFFLNPDYEGIRNGGF